MAPIRPKPGKPVGIDSCEASSSSSAEIPQNRNIGTFLSFADEFSRLTPDMPVRSSPGPTGRSSPMILDPKNTHPNDGRPKPSREGTPMSDVQNTASVLSTDSSPIDNWHPVGPAGQMTKQVAGGGRPPSLQWILFQRPENADMASSIYMASIEIVQTLLNTLGEETSEQHALYQAWSENREVFKDLESYRIPEGVLRIVLKDALQVLAAAKLEMETRKWLRTPQDAFGKFVQTGLGGNAARDSRSQR